MMDSAIVARNEIYVTNEILLSCRCRLARDYLFSCKQPGESIASDMWKAMTHKIENLLYRSVNDWTDDLNLFLSQLFQFTLIENKVLITYMIESINFLLENLNESYQPKNIFTSLDSFVESYTSNTITSNAFQALSDIGEEVFNPNGINSSEIQLAKSIYLIFIQSHNHVTF